MHVYICLAANVLSIILEFILHMQIALGMFEENPKVFLCLEQFLDGLKELKISPTRGERCASCIVYSTGLSIRDFHIACGL